MEMGKDEILLQLKREWDLIKESCDKEARQDFISKILEVKVHGITFYQLSRATGIPASTLGGWSKVWRLKKKLQGNPRGSKFKELNVKGSLEVGLEMSVEIHLGEMRIKIERAQMLKVAELVKELKSC